MCVCVCVCVCVYISIRNNKEISLVVVLFQTLCAVSHLHGPAFSYLGLRFNLMEIRTVASRVTEQLHMLSPSLL